MSSLTIVLFCWQPLVPVDSRPPPCLCFSHGLPSASALLDRAVQQPTDERQGEEEGSGNWQVPPDTLKVASAFGYGRRGSIPFFRRTMQYYLVVVRISWSRFQSEDHLESARLVQVSLSLTIMFHSETKTSHNK